MVHNLPEEKPYKKFFGRKKTIKLIKNKLLDRLGHIASIDGVGGIGKTALTYKFCEDVIIKDEYFDYLIWVSAKEDRFDPHEKTGEYIKKINNPFSANSITNLIDETIRVIGFEDYFQDKSIVEKKAFFENEILSNEKVFFVIDNLESISDKDFFQYIDNFASYKNLDLKVLTTSRRRAKELTDNAILIEEISEEDAISMLKFYAEFVVDKPVKAILNNSLLQNRKLVNRIGRIPLVIEFLVGQMSNGKSIGQIFEELDGFPDLNTVKGEEKKKVMSDIIDFSFKNMYENLTHEHQRILMLIASWERNKSRGNGDASIEFLLSLSGYSISKIREIVNDLVQNQLVVPNPNGDTFTMKKMAINFSRQFYDDFDKIEEEVEILRSNLQSNKDNSEVLTKRRETIILKRIDSLISNREFQEAENIIKNVIGDQPFSENAELHHKLAIVYKSLSQWEKANDFFMKATKLDPKNRTIWFDWIDMEDIKGRKGYAKSKAEQALVETNNDYLILNQLLNIHKYEKDFITFRDKAEKYLDYYKNNNRDDSYLKLLRYWKSVEFNLLREDKGSKYFKLIDTLINEENSNHSRFSLVKEALKVAKKMKNKPEIEKYKNKTKAIEGKLINNIDGDIRQLKRLFNLNHNDEALKEANRILQVLNRKGKKSYKGKRVIVNRIQMQTLASQGDYIKAIDIYKENLEILRNDNNCQSIFKKGVKLHNEEFGEDILTTIDAWKSKIGEGLIRDVIKDMKGYYSLFLEKEEVNDLILLEGLLSRAEDNHNKGLSLSGELSNARSQVSKALLSKIDKLYQN